MFEGTENLELDERFSLMKGDEVVEMVEQHANSTLLGRIHWHDKLSP
jgi:hypothetical protein